MMLAGGCLCGAVRYEIDAPPINRTACHCTICRRASGAPFVAWFSVARSAFRLGVDDVTLTLGYEAQIAAFEMRQHEQMGWLDGR